MQINQDVIFYLLKRKPAVSLFIYIFSRLTYKMKDEIDNQIPFPQSLEEYSLMLYAVWNDYKTLNANRVPAIQNVFKNPTRPPAVFYYSGFTFFKLYKWYQIAQRITYANI